MNKTIIKQFSYILKTTRLQKKLTQEQLAYKSGLSCKYVGRIESGRVNPSLKTMLKISEALGVNITDLVDKL